MREGDKATYEYRILIVDDGSDIMLTLKIILENSGFRIQAFTDPILALTNFTAHSYDLALLDIQMPKITGLGLCKELIKIDNKIKENSVQLLTGRMERF
jgi:CheY-like chemotaxis protein